ncbi:MAG: S8 family serine peptidase, partial [Synergistaceae bacterium]|nr:S8 family serine peptidase [Synergistaceae bacterium]
MKKLLALLFFMSLAFSASAQDAVPGDVIVVLRNDSGMRINSAQNALGGGKSLSAVKSFETSNNVRVLETFDALSNKGSKIFMVVHSDTEDENTLLRRVRNNPSVIAASLNYRYTLNLPESSKTPDDPEYHRLWGMDVINAPQAWTFGTGSEDVYVAVVDSGVDYNHPDLKDNFSHEYSRNFVGHTESGYDPSAYYDENGHGTHCSGTIAGVGNNALGVAGVNWKAKIISARVMDANGRGDYANIIAAFNYLAGILADNPKLNIAAVNFSVGGFDEGTPEEIIAENNPFWLAMKEISDTDRLVLCVAAGNEAVDIGAPTPSTSYYNGRAEWLRGYYEHPCSFLGISNMIAVAAADPSLEMSSFSNYNRKYVDIAAPGRDIYSTLPTTYIDTHTYSYAALQTLYPYEKMSGTSMATPHVTGAAALLKYIFPKATASQIKAALLGGANGDYLRDDGTSAYGLLDLTGAINFMARIMSQDTPPVITDVSLPAGIKRQRYKTEFYASGTQPLTWTLDGELPEGLSFDKNGQISGTPTESGSFDFTVTASNEYGTSSLALTLTISAQVAPEIIRPYQGYLPGDFYVSTDVYYVDVPMEAGDWPMEWSIGSGDVPDDFGMGINKDGILAFKPTKAGTFSLPVTVSNDSGSDSYTFKVAVKEAKAPEIFETKTHTLYLGRAANMLYDEAAGTIEAEAVTVSVYGSKPISWDVQGLPKGISFDVIKGGGSSELDEILRRDDIALTGRPEESGDFRVIVTASNPYGTDSTSFDLHVVDERPHFLEAVSSLRTLEKDTEFTFAAPLTGSSPITFTVSGDLPDNVHITSEDDVLRVYGKPTKTGHYSFTVIAENECGKGESGLTFNINVIEPIAVTTYKLPDAVAGVS